MQGIDLGRLILDTGVLIASMRGRVDLTALGDVDDVAIAPISVAEYLGRYLARRGPRAGSSPTGLPGRCVTGHPDARLRPLGADQHAALLAQVRRSGVQHGVHDLIIAATAWATGGTILTTDQRACFGDLPEVTARLIEADRGGT